MCNIIYPNWGGRTERLTGMSAQKRQGVRASTGKIFERKADLEPKVLVSTGITAFRRMRSSLPFPKPVLLKETQEERVLLSISFCTRVFTGALRRDLALKQNLRKNKPLGEGGWRLAQIIRHRPNAWSAGRGR